jgi:hypothetical protein
MNKIIKQMKKIIIIAILGLLGINAAFSQTGFGTSTPDANAIIDAYAADKGILIPRVDITDLATAAPLPATPTTGMLVYNTNATTGVGFYHWHGTVWVKFALTTDINNEWADATEIGKSGFVYAKQAMAAGDTIVVTDDGNIGIGEPAPTNRLHVKAATDPLKLEGVQTATDDTLLTIDVTGVIHKIAASSIAASAGPAKIVFSSEYAGGTLFADGSDNAGAMTSDNAGSSNSWMNYYDWTSTETSLNDYDIILRFTVPDDFATWQVNAIEVDYTVSAAADANLTANIYEENSALAIAILSSSTSTSWGVASIASDTDLSTLVAGETAVIVLKLAAKDGGSVRIGDITINYNK